LRPADKEKVIGMLKAAVETEKNENTKQEMAAQLEYLQNPDVKSSVSKQR
jgi:hypothetical protein